MLSSGTCRLKLAPQLFAADQCLLGSECDPMTLVPELVQCPYSAQRQTKNQADSAPAPSCGPSLRPLMGMVICLRNTSWGARSTTKK